MPPSPPTADGRPQKRQRTTGDGIIERSETSCPYLDTIDRTVLNFDLPWLCSVTLKSHNIYVCLVTGRFFHGRAPSSPAYMHALQEGHHLFLNLSEGHVYSLPDGDIVHSSALSDIVATLQPRFTSADLEPLDRERVDVKLVDGSTRLRGAVGLDNLHGSAYANVILQLILRPSPVRNALLLHIPAAHVELQPRINVALHNTLADISRKLWASNAFRPLVAPHTLMHLVDREYTKKRPATAKDNPIMFCAWLLNSLGNTKRVPHGEPDAADLFARLITKTFKGEMEVVTYGKDGVSKKKPSSFWFLSLDLPQKPLFKHESEKEIVEQVPLEKLLTKFNGASRHHVVETGETRSYNVTSLPPYLLLVLKRFTKSKFVTEKNPCVVHLPAGGLELSWIHSQTHNKYRLLGAVSHHGSLEKGEYRVSIFHEATETWYEMAGSSVEPTLFQLVSLTDTYILLYGRDETALADP